MNAVKTAVIFCLVLGSSLWRTTELYAETVAEYATRVDSVYQQFNRYTQKDINAIKRTTAIEVVDEFEDALDLLDEIASSNLTKAEQDPLLEKLAQVLGGFYIEINKPFRDLSLEQPSWLELQREGRSDNVVWKAGRWVGGLILSGINTLGREFFGTVPWFEKVEIEGYGHERRIQIRWPTITPISGLAKLTSEFFHGALDDRSRFSWPVRYIFPLRFREALTEGVDRAVSPLMGADARRADAVGDMADMVYTAIKTDLKSEVSPAADQRLATLRRLVEIMERSESSGNRIRSFWAIFGLKALAVEQFIHPWLKLPPPPFELSAYSNFLSSVFWASVALYWAQARALDTGYRGAKRIQKVLTLANSPRYRERWNSCALAIEDAAAEAAGAVFSPEPVRAKARRARYSP